MEVVTCTCSDVAVSDDDKVVVVSAWEEEVVGNK